jgi:hypothetical protein
MRAAYLNQLINLVVTILLVPVLLRYLNLTDYLLWAIFTTFGSLTLQFESAIQNASIREIAAAFFGRDMESLVGAIGKARFAYRLLAGFVMVPLFAVGAVYLHSLTTLRHESGVTMEWLLFVIAYAANYNFGINNTVLLGMGRVKYFNNTTSFTRTLNFVLTLVMLQAGFAIMGLCISFLASVAVGCTIIAVAAKRLLRDEGIASRLTLRTAARSGGTDSSNILKYTAYSVASFTLYRGGLLLATVALPKSVAAAYGLTLQAAAILFTLGQVPLQVWLRKLASAVAARDHRDILRELYLSLITANAIFVAGSMALLLCGNLLLTAIGSRVMLAGGAEQLLICLAFLIELNIAILVNFLVTMNDYSFLPVYLTSSGAGIASVVILSFVASDNITLWVAVPVGLQMLVCAPRIFKRMCSELSISTAGFIGELGKFLTLQFGRN